MYLPFITKIWFYYTLSAFSVSAWVNHYEIKFPNVVVKQPILETGWYKCKNCSLDYNNIFGFKTNEYLKDSTFILSIERYKIWQEKYMPEVCSEDEYLLWLDEYGYAKAKNYTKTIKNIKI